MQLPTRISRRKSWTGKGLSAWQPYSVLACVQLNCNVDGQSDAQAPASNPRSGAVGGVMNDDHEEENRRKEGCYEVHYPGVGDLVQVNFGGDEVKGRVVENRGRIGVRGRNLYRILLQMDLASR